MRSDVPSNAVIDSDDDSDSSCPSVSNSADDSYSSCTSSDDSGSDESASEGSDSGDSESDDSDFVGSEDDGPRRKPKKAAKEYTKLVVEPRQTSRVHAEAAKRNMSVSALMRIIKTFIMTEGGDTDGERQNAERALSTLMRAHDLERADVASLAAPLAESELLDRGSEMRCTGANLRLSWVYTLANACSKLYSVAYYLLGGTQHIVFYGEAGSASACAYLFAELHPTILQLTDEYMVRRTNSTVNPLTARASYRHGLCDEFNTLAWAVSDQRKQYVERCLAESEARRIAVAERLAELQEKQRIQKLSAMRVVAETLATVDAAAGPSVTTAQAADTAAAADAPAPEVADPAAAASAAHAHEAEEDDAKACAICWEPMKLGVAFITNPCGHTFHVECQAKAVSARLVTCGLCRAPLTLTVFSASPQASHDVDDDDGDEDLYYEDGHGVSDSSDSDSSEPDDDSSSDYEADEGDSSDDDAALPVADAGPAAPAAIGAAAAGADDDDDVEIVACYTAEQAADIRRAKSDMIDLTEEELLAQAQDADRVHTEAKTLALVATRDAELINAMKKKIFNDHQHRKDGTLKRSAFVKAKRVVRDRDAYQAGKSDAKRLKTGDALQH